MSNDPVRLTFPDGTQLFTMGDSSSIQSIRLFPTQDEAQQRYNDRWEGIEYPTDEEMAAAKETEEVVVIETNYASSDDSFKEMLTPYCKASKDKRIITDGPDYNDDMPSLLGYPE